MMFDEDEFGEVQALSKDDAEKIKDGVDIGLGVLTAIGSVVVAVVGLISFFSNDSKKD